MGDIDWGAPRVVITRQQEIEAAARVEEYLIGRPDFQEENGLTRDDLLVLIRTTRGYHRG